MSKINKISYVSTILVCILMSAIMPLGMLLLKCGLCNNLGAMWFNDFLTSCCIAIPSGLIIVPNVEKLLKYFTRNKFKSTCNKPKIEMK